MKRELTTILKSFKEVRLSTHEKQALRNNLIKEINLVPSPLSRWYFVLWSHQMKITYGVLFVMLSFSSSVVLASGQALPGDILYPVKTKLAEKVERAFVASTPDDQAQFETRLVARRLEEAEKLEKDKDFEEKTKNLAKREIEQQLEKAEAAIFAITPVVPEESASLMMASFSVSSEPVAEDSSSRKVDEDDSDEDRNNNADIDNADDSNRENSGMSRKSDIESSNLSDDVSNQENENRGKSKGRDKEDKIDLDQVLEKHKDIVQKLDIKKGRGSDKNNRN